MRVVGKPEPEVLALWKAIKILLKVGRAEGIECKTDAVHELSNGYVTVITLYIPKGKKIEDQMPRV